jgi:hypothetical protein
VCGNTPEFEKCPFLGKSLNLVDYAIVCDVTHSPNVSPTKRGQQKRQRKGGTKRNEKGRNSFLSAAIVISAIEAGRGTFQNGCASVSRGCVLSRRTEAVNWPSSCGQEASSSSSPRAASDACPALRRGHRGKPRSHGPCRRARAAPRRDLTMWYTRPPRGRCGMDVQIPRDAGEELRPFSFTRF